jgi:anti-sigma-K factor RskA
MNGSHVEIEELIAAYAVHALDVDERARVQTEILEHIAGCDSCRSLFRELNELSGELALASPPARVTQELEDRVMNAARGVRAAVPVKQRQRRWPGIAAAVAAAAVIGLAIWNVQLGSNLRDAQSNSRTAIQALAVLSDPNARHANLIGAQGSISLALRSDGSVAMAASGLQALPGGKVYELWLFHENIPTAAGVFTPEAGTAIVTARRAGTYDAAGITIENAPNGATTPTSSPLYAGRLA